MPPKKATATKATSKATPATSKTPAAKAATSKAVSNKIATAKAPTTKAASKASTAKLAGVTKSATIKSIPSRPAPKKTGAQTNGEVQPTVNGAGNHEGKSCSRVPRVLAEANVKLVPNGVPKEANTGKKRKLATEDRASTAVKRPKATKSTVINQAPTKRLNVYVFGEASNGENGLGSAKNAVDVKRPRLNHNLEANSVGVVQIAVGGMHAVALTYDNQILTWGVNDQGALGRDTAWNGGMKELDDAGSDDDSSSRGSDSGMNPKESTPTAIDPSMFPHDVTFVQVAAGDSASFAVTNDGFVYGWGTFRVSSPVLYESAFTDRVQGNEGILGFDAKTKIQAIPTLLPDLKKISSIACGANHVLALDAKGNVFAWGSGQQNQLGRRVIERTKLGGLVPREFGLPKNKITFVSAGDYHSFAIDKKGDVWSWGLNSYGETGITENAGEDDAVVLKPTQITSLSGKKVTDIQGGAHHSIAATADHKCLVWGRVDGAQMGISAATLSQNPDIVKDSRDRPRIAPLPLLVPGIKAKKVAAGSDTSMAIDTEGKVWTWGFSANYQTGQGVDEDVEVATAIANTAVKGKRITWGGVGGQFAVIAEEVQDPGWMANGY
jgi:regulator of chromosome condensation